MLIRRHFSAALGLLLVANMALVLPVSAESTTIAPSPEPVVLPAVIDTAPGVTLSDAERRNYDAQWASEEGSQSPYGLSAFRASAEVKGQMTIDYVDATPAEVRAAMDAAVASWAQTLELSPNAPVVITMKWRDLGHPGILGQAGANGYYPGEAFGLSGLIPAPLANVLSGSDYHSDDTEIEVKLNSAFASWHLDPNSPPPFDKIDLYSVALHEIGHGIGFAGSARDTCGACADLQDGPLAFDHKVLYEDQPVLDAVESFNPNYILTSGALSFDLGSGRKYKTYAPSPFENGSSYSHFDEDAYLAGAAGALMSPSISHGEVERDLDSPVLGVLAQIGWPMAVPPATPNINWVDPAQAGEISLGWSEDLYVRATPAHYYNLAAYRAGVLDASQDLPWNVGTATLTGIEPGSDYEIVLTPVGAQNLGAAAKINVRSATDPSDPQPPTTPGNPQITAQGSGRGVKIGWPASQDNVGVIGYRVYRDGDELIKTVSVPNAHLSLDIGEHHLYVRAFDAAGNVSAPSGFVTVFIESDPIQDLAREPGFTAEHANVLRLYWAFFNRDPDISGARYWIDISNRGYSLDVIAENFAAGQEFQVTYGSARDDNFLRSVYYNVLGRSADLSGFNYWLGQMQSGLSRGGVVRWISANSEFVAQHQYPSS